MPELSFTPSNHAYLCDGERLPSTTEILRAAGLASSYSFAKPIHRFRGSSVHHGCAIIDLGGEPRVRLNPLYERDPDHIKVAQEIPVYWQAFRDAKRDTGFQGCIWECSFIDCAAGYAGTFDCAGYTDGGEEIWDLKSGTMPPLVAVQLAAYWDLILRGSPVNPAHAGLPWLVEVVRSGHIVRRKALRLDKTGKYKIYSETNKGDHFDSPIWTDVWRAALLLYRLLPRLCDGKPQYAYLRNLIWLAGKIKAQLRGAERDAALEAGRLLYRVRQKYNMLKVY